jgi:hypothetical protein
MSEPIAPSPDTEIRPSAWFAAVFIALGWIASIWAAFGGAIRWWNWVSLCGSTTMVAAVFLIRRRLRLARALILVTALLVIVGIFGQFNSYR